MMERRNGRISVVRPGNAERARIRFILLTLILLGACGVLALLLTGLHDGVLSLSLPAYRLLVTQGPGESPAPERRTAGAPSPMPIAVSDVETVHQSVEALSPGETAQPQVLIYHTHATEAYLNTPEHPYAESGSWRTEDRQRSVVAVGELLAETLREDYGLGVLHDVNNYEPPKLSTAYGRSLTGMLAYRARYPSLRVYIDVHRDAYGAAGTLNGEPRDFVVLDGMELARIMFVVGTGRGATGAGFNELPDFDANYAFAAAVTETLNAMDPALAREVRVKTGRYNQHVSPRCLLVEVGHNANTLAQALNSVPYLAAAIDRALNDGAIETASMPGRDVWTPQEADLPRREENGG